MFRNVIAEIIRSAELRTDNVNVSDNVRSVTLASADDCDSFANTRRKCILRSRFNGFVTTDDCPGVRDCS